MSTLAERLEQAMADKGVKPADLARACNVKPPSVSDWLTGKTKKLEGANLLMAAEYLGVSPWWLATGKHPGERLPGSKEFIRLADDTWVDADSPEGKAARPPVDAPMRPHAEPLGNLAIIGSREDAPFEEDKFRSAPLLTWQQAGDLRKLLPGKIEASEWFPIPFGGSGNCFWLKVEGESMYDPSAERSYANGDFILVDASRAPENRSYVILRLSENEGGVSFKQLLIDPDGTKMLKSLNPSWPNRLIHASTDPYIIGVVIGKWVPE